MTGDALTVGIMGAGRMAQGFDAPGDGPVLSLAHAVTRTRGLVLGGFFDTKPERAAAAELRWGCAMSPRARSAWLNVGWDVIVIATPDEQHASDLREVLARKPRAVLVEKPLALDAREGDMLLESARCTRVGLLTNFPRRQHSAVAAVARHVAEGQLGAPLAMNFVFSGADSHAAIHMLDLLHGWWAGWSIEKVTTQEKSALLALRRDAQLSAASFHSLPADHHYVWEMTVDCARGRIRLGESPERLTLSLTQPHELYTDFNVLNPILEADMEDEPLLERVMASLHTIATDSAAASRQLTHETAVQKFCGAVLDALRVPPGITV